MKISHRLSAFATLLQLFLAFNLIYQAWLLSFIPLHFLSNPAQFFVSLSAPKVAETMKQKPIKTTFKEPREICSHFNIEKATVLIFYALFARDSLQY
jgi:uncharacterized protein YcfJ